MKNVKPGLMKILVMLSALSLVLAEVSGVRFSRRPILIQARWCGSSFASVTGSSADTVGRAIAAKLTERLGKPVIVENHGGAGGVIGSEMVAKSAPDGHTLLVVAAYYATNPAFYKLPFDPVNSLIPDCEAGNRDDGARRPSERSGQLGERAYRSRETEARPADLGDFGSRQQPASGG